MLAFYIVALVIDLAVFGGFLYRYRQTSARPYLHLALASLALALSAAVLAFLGDMIFSSVLLTLVIIYVAAIVASLASLVMVMVVLGLLRTWINSMRTHHTPAAAKLDKCDTTCRYLRLTYPGLTLLAIVFYVLLIVSLDFATILALVVSLVFTLAVIIQCAVIIWLYIDLHGEKCTHDSEVRKRNQLLKLAGLTFFGAWPAMLAGVGAGIGGSVCWWIWYIIALWPGALLGFEDPVLVHSQGVQPGMADKPMFGSPHQQQHPAGTLYPQRPAPYDPNRIAAAQQQPQAAYQPQYQQPYGGQPMQPGYMQQSPYQG